MSFESLLFRLLRAAPPGLAVVASLSCNSQGHANAADATPRFQLPVRCQLNVNCFVQNYVDHGSADEVRDFACNKRSYKGHNGTDFRVPDILALGAGIDVLSVADGTVLRVRNNIADTLVQKSTESLAPNTECGNGVVIAHKAGWSTQYCHLARGSVQVTPGDRVIGGQAIGHVGLSGRTAFPHVHLTVRHNDKIVDPFAHGATPGVCGSGELLWEPPLNNTKIYHDSDVLNFGFSSAPVTMDRIETGEVKQSPVDRETPLIAYVRTIGLRAGDEQTLSIRRLDGEQLVSYAASPLERDRAQSFISAGRPRPASTWPEGIYIATFHVKREGVEILMTKFEQIVGRGAGQNKTTD
jgi:murein DD-endopeptidase MepM/ murein hydrolase activator NlpD